MLSWGYPQLCGGSGLLGASEGPRFDLHLGTPIFTVPPHLRSPSLEVHVAGEGANFQEAVGGFQPDESRPQRLGCECGSCGKDT